MIEGSCHCGAVRWRFDGAPDHATACNCTACRRYGALWAYGHEDVDVHLSGETRTYSHGDRRLAFHSCPTCGCIAYWRGLAPGEDGRRRVGVNLRMSDPEAVGAIVVRHLDGFDTWSDQPRDARSVADLWF